MPHSRLFARLFVGLSAAMQKRGQSLAGSKVIQVNSHDLMPALRRRG